MWLIGQLRSRVRYKIIWPFLLLAVCIAVIGSSIAFSLIASSWQERFLNQLASSTRIANDTLLAQERSNLLFLRQVALSGANTQTGAPAVSAAVSNDDIDGLLLALDPFVRVGIADTNVQLDRLIIFDQQRRTLVDMERHPASDVGYRLNALPDIAQLWFVPRVLAEHTGVEDDKYAGLIELPAEEGGSTTYLATVVPIRQDDESPIVGGALMAVRLDRLLGTLLQRSHASIVTIYDTRGLPLISTAFPNAGLSGAELSEDDSSTRPSIMQLQMAAEDLGKLEAYANPENLDDLPVVTTITAAGRSYQVFYTYLVIHNARVGILSTGMPADYVFQWSNETRPMVLALTMLVMLLVILIGTRITRQVTEPLEQLVATAGAFVSGGSRQDGNSDLLPDNSRAARDEVSILSHSFKRMTEKQRHLVRDVLRESAVRAAILESIPDGLVVCDTAGQIQSMNPMMYRFLELDASATAPTTFQDLPLELVTEPIFGSRLNDLYILNNRYLRLSKSAIRIDRELYVGDVYVLQDMTPEVQVDQAKTTFTATISHEMRTPLTVIHGNTQFLQRGLLGELNPDQQMMVDSIFKHTNNMSRALANVILAAEIDSGAFQLNCEELDLEPLIQEATLGLQRQIREKELNFRVHIAPDIPPVYADRVMLSRILEQVVHNACTYTAAGSITITAQAHDQDVQINVLDSGTGIDPTLLPQVFERFVRGSGDEANSRNDRGIGLGLTISRQLIEAQQGRIWIESQPGAGTAVRFMVPRAVADQAAVPVRPAPVSALADGTAEDGEPLSTQPDCCPPPPHEALALPTIATGLLHTILPGNPVLEQTRQRLQQTGFWPETQTSAGDRDLGQLPAHIFQELLLETLPLFHERWQQRQRPLSAVNEWTRQHFVSVLSLDETSPTSTGILASRSTQARPLFADAHISGLLDVNNRLPHALWYDEAGGSHWARHFWERAATVLQPDTLLIAAPSAQAFIAMTGLSDLGVSIIIPSPPARGWRRLQTLAQTDRIRDRIVQFQDRRRLQNRPLRLVEYQEQSKVYRYLTNHLDTETLPADWIHMIAGQPQSIRALFISLGQILAREHGPLYTQIRSDQRNVAKLQVWSAWLLYVALLDAADQLAAHLQCTADTIPLHSVYRNLWQYWSHDRGQCEDPMSMMAQQYPADATRFDVLANQLSDVPSPAIAGHP